MTGHQLDLFPEPNVVQLARPAVEQGVLDRLYSAREAAIRTAARSILVVSISSDGGFAVAHSVTRWTDYWSLLGALEYVKQDLLACAE